MMQNVHGFNKLEWLLLSSQNSQHTHKNYFWATALDSKEISLLVTAQQQFIFYQLGIW